MATPAQFQAAHDLLYRGQRTGVWARRVGYGALVIGGCGAGWWLLAAVLAAFGAGPSVDLDRWEGWLQVGVSTALSAGGWLMVSGGRVLAAVLPTRETDRVRRACRRVVLGSALASAPAIWVVVGTGLALVGLIERNGPKAVFPSAYVGCCLLVVALPLPLLAVSGWLWLRLPVAVADVFEGRAMIRGQGEAAEAAPPPPGA